MLYFSTVSDDRIVHMVRLASVLNTCIMTAFECLKVHRLVEVWRSWLFKIVSAEQDDAGVKSSTVQTVYTLFRLFGPLQRLLDDYLIVACAHSASKEICLSKYPLECVQLRLNDYLRAHCDFKLIFGELNQFLHELCPKQFEGSLGLIEK